MEVSIPSANPTQRGVIVMTSTESRMANKQKLINDLKAIFDSWEKALAGMNESEITAHPPGGQYSISEVVSHLHAWQQISIAYVKAALNDTQPKFPAWLRGADPSYAEDHVDEFNARIQELWRVYSWPKRYREWREGFLHFLEFAAAVPDTVMFDTERYTWLHGSSLAAVLEGSCEHHQHHLTGILSSMDNQRDSLSPVIWKRHDLPGHEACRILKLDGGWGLVGVSVFFSQGNACRLNYQIHCDQEWITRLAHVDGWVGDRTISLTIERNDAGQWNLNGEECEAVSGCFDIDLNFSPSTNLLPIRRLALAQDETASVRAAWLRFPTFVLEPLEQSYTRIGSRCYRYESSRGEFVANISVDANGLAVDYANLWSRVS